jgi:formyltetrahydrofolate hydrolase
VTLETNLKNLKINLKISTKDEKGLIYNISKVLFANNLNIDQNAEYVDEETNEFFMRSLISGKVMETILQKELKEVLPKGAKITLNKNTKKDVVLLVTKESHVLGDLLIRYSSNELNANIKAVIGNHEDLRKDKPNAELLNRTTKSYCGQSKRNILKQLPKLKDVNFINGSYLDMVIPPNSLIYCDPPYEGTTAYKDGFDHNVFWQWCRDKAN